jgi:hypothetical protein
LQGVGQGIVRHGRSWRVTQLPPFSAGRVTLRLRTCTPPPQLAEHSDHSPHGAVSQSTVGHGDVLQGVCWRRDGHVPPGLGDTTTVRLRSFTPPPHHCTVHSLKGPQALISHLVGHASVLQARVWCSLRHTLPP